MSWITCFYFLLSILLITIRSSAIPINNKDLSSLLLQNVAQGIPFTRTIRIYSRSSRWHLRVVGSKIDGLSKKPGDPNSVMILESVNLLGHIRIKSKMENTYICVSKLGKLVLEHNGQTLTRCVFVEDYHKGFTLFKSIFNNKWFLGVKHKSGLMKRPSHTNNTQKAALFLVEEVQRSSI